MYNGLFIAFVIYNHSFNLIFAIIITFLIDSEKYFFLSKLFVSHSQKKSDNVIHCKIESSLLTSRNLIFRTFFTLKNESEKVKIKFRFLKARKNNLFKKKPNYENENFWLSANLYFRQHFKI